MGLCAPLSQGDTQQLAASSPNQALLHLSVPAHVHRTGGPSSLPLCLTHSKSVPESLQQQENKNSLLYRSVDHDQGSRDTWI